MRTLIALLISAGLAAGSSVAILSSSPPASAPYTLLVDEDFEGAGTPGGWSGGGGDFDSTTNPLVGAQSFRCDTGESGSVTITAQGTIYGKFRFRALTLPASYSTIAQIFDAGFATLGKVQILSTGALLIDSGGIFQITTATMSANTAYDIWFRITKGTGSNSIGRVWFATAGSAKPADGSNNSAGATNGTITADATLVQFPSDGGVTLDFDSVQIAATDF